MNALAEKIKDTYKLQIHRGNGNAYGFCVGGAACHYLTDYITWDYIYQNPDVVITESMKKFPHQDDLEVALKQLVGYTYANPAGYSSVAYYAESIVASNDEGEYNEAWETLSEFFDEYELDECGECGELRQGDARILGGMRCGVCAYG